MSYESEKNKSDEELSSINTEDSCYDFGENETTVVLVTGANGYLGCHIVKKLLEKGVRVKATVRNIERAGVLLDFKMEYHDRLEIFEIKIEDFITKWKGILQGCTGIIHTASPNPTSPVKNQTDLVFPAIEGTLNMLQSAVELGIKKVVLTGCICCVRGKDYKQYFSEEDWADPDALTPTERCKLMTERTAWAFMRENENIFGFTVILPGFLIGPSLQNSYKSSSALVIRSIASGEVDSILKLHISTCDVRNAAEAHINAFWSKKSNSKRYICVENSHWLEEVPKEILEKFEPQGYEISQSITPKWKLSLANLYDSNVKSILTYYNKEVYYTDQSIINDLNIDFKAFSQSIEEMVSDMVLKKVVTSLRERSQGDEMRPLVAREGKKQGGISGFFAKITDVWKAKKTK